MRPGAELTTGSIPRRLFAFALPILLGNVLQSINGSINAIWVGNFLGTAALTATNNSNIVMFLLLGAVFGITMASTILIAQAVGAQQPDAVEVVLGFGVGQFAASRVRLLCEGRRPHGAILHPSPASPQANLGWAPQAEAQLAAQGFVVPPP